MSGITEKNTSGKKGLVDFLNTELGMHTCGNSAECYQEALLTFFREESLEDIEAFYELRDWESYGASLLILKNRALAIGAETLFEEARKLEIAAKEKNHYYIDKHHRKVMLEYRQLLEEIFRGFIQKEQEENPEVCREKTAQILVIDDDEMTLMYAEKVLGECFEVKCISSGKEALDYMEHTIPELILMDVYMPEMNGFELFASLQENPETSEIPVIFLSMDTDRGVESRCFQRGAQDFILKPLRADILVQRVSHVLELSRLQRDLQSEVKKQTWKAEERRKKVERLSEQIIDALTEAIDAKDSYTQGHSRRVAEYASTIAARAGKDKKTQENIRYMGMLHDIGKIGIPDSIITKSSSLSDKEFFVTRKHPEIGAEILSTISEMPGLAVGARYHHERYDGTGYPDGLAGEAIPEEARIIAVADAYDAMASKRSYRDVLPQNIVYEEIRKGRGTQFDPVFADIMLAMMEEDTEYDMREK